MNEPRQPTPESEGPIGDNPLTRAVTALSDHADSLSPAVFDLFQQKLAAHLRRQFRQLSTDDLHDVTIDVILKLVDRVGAVGPPPNDGYIYRAARNAAIDRLRKGAASANQTGFDDSGAEFGSDDDVAAAFEAMATAASLLDALHIASKRGDHVAYRAATLALVETEHQGKRPSNRWLAEQMSLSHTAVNKALARFRGYLDIDSS